ncbi:MAG: radical SAM protein [Erysipelotrichaceae bacterium]|nr:radical SAM protein [Erysipelotrichaceae bacterium]
MHYIEAKTLLSSTNGMNIYRGCTHGCIYCDSRSVVYGMDHAFEDIAVKENALILLERALQSKRKKCMIGTGSMSDPYMPLENKLKMTRKALELIDRYGFGVTLITKSDLVLRDIDLLESINKKAKAVVQITLTTIDDDLCRILEPNVCPTSKRIEVLRILQERGIPTIVWMTPILPYINDTKENINGLLDACIETGVKGIIMFGIGMTLREGNREYYYQALDQHFPGLRRKYIRQYGNAYQLNSPHNHELMTLFHRKCQAHNIMDDPEECFQYLQEFPEAYHQTSIFDFIDD